MPFSVWAQRAHHGCARRRSPRTASVAGSAAITPEGWTGGWRETGTGPRPWPGCPAGAHRLHRRPGRTNPIAAPTCTRPQRRFAPGSSMSAAVRTARAHAYGQPSAAAQGRRRPRRGSGPQAPRRSTEHAGSIMRMIVTAAGWGRRCPHQHDPRSRRGLPGRVTAPPRGGGRAGAGRSVREGHPGGRRPRAAPAPGPGGTRATDRRPRRPPRGRRPTVGTGSSP